MSGETIDLLALVRGFAFGLGIGLLAAWIARILTGKPWGSSVIVGLAVGLISGVFVFRSWPGLATVPNLGARLAQKQR